MLKIFNTLSNRKELFKPINVNKVNIYVCGVTVSNYCHLGHGRTFYFFDILLKYLIHLGYKCNYVRNITDVDDVLLNNKFFLEKNVYLNNFLNLMINSMWNNFKFLGLKKPNYEPKVSDNINLIIKNILFLIKNKFAYISPLNGDILFSVKNYNNYGIFFFNKKKLYIYKKDFVLWKKNNNNDFFGWNSPWGFGRPGWHIGCSTISNKYLSNKIDIHGGGLDLKFPHHENEFTQSKCLFGKKYLSNYWIHTGMVINNKGKLSKSKNNVFLLHNLSKFYHQDVIKYFFMSKHYRKNLFFDISKLEKYKFCVNKFYLSLNDMNLSLVLSKKDLIDFKEFDNIFYSFLNDDFDISNIYVFFHYILGEINKLKNSNLLLSNKLAIKMCCLSKIIGLFNDKPINFLKNTKNSIFLLKKINNLIKIRNIARKNKDWKKADFLRDKLFKKFNIILNDKKKFITDWYFK